MANPLDPFIGAWDIEAFGGVGHATFAYTLDDQFLVQRSEAPDPAPDGLAIVAFDAETGAGTQHYFDARGVVRIYAMTLCDGVWTLLRDKPDFTPLSFSQRFTGTFSADGDRIDARWEKSDDGASWELDFELTYRRA